jgi:uncharacterized protein YkwD
MPEGSVAGYPITVTFPADKQVTAASIEVCDDKGTPLDGTQWTPEKPARAGRQANTITFIPRGLLQGNAVYQVKAAAQLDGKSWQREWSFTTDDDTDTKGVSAKKALAIVNDYRTKAGLKPVALDDALGQACAKHARYLVMNEGHPALEGLKAHGEDLTLPGASKEGKDAGLASNIAIGDFAPLDGLHNWMATLYHRVQMLDPRLERVGFACARGRRQGWVILLNVVTGRTAGDRADIVIYPAPDQAGVPLTFPNGGEEPNPLPADKTGRAGYPITASFPMSIAVPNKTPFTRGSATLKDAKGAEVPCWFSSPEKLANPKFAGHQSNTVCLIPKAPLPANSVLEVHMQGELAGKPWQKKWKFTTGGAGPSAADASRAVYERINAYRALAGLNAITPDDKLSRGCQLHAEYLARNTLELQKSRVSPNDEDPLLPGYTFEGRAAAKHADVFTNAPTPIAQIDDVMATFSRRIFLLDPGLVRVGYGCAHDLGRGWRCVLDLNGRRSDGPVVVYPVPRQEEVPLVGYDHVAEAKGKPGYPISVTFSRQAVPRNAAAVLRDAAGKAVDVAVIASDKAGQRNTIAVHPLAPLLPNHTYTVTVGAIVGSSEWRQEWSFTTASN